MATVVAVLRVYVWADCSRISENGRNTCAGSPFSVATLRPPSSQSLSSDIPTPSPQPRVLVLDGSVLACSMPSIMAFTRARACVDLADLLRVMMIYTTTATPRMHDPLIHLTIPPVIYPSYLV